jgi:type IV secretion system protein VirB11
MTEAASYLEHYLEPLAPFLGRRDVTDIYVNRPGEVWIETLGGTIERLDEPSLTLERLWRLAWQIANASSQGISAQHPLLAATLPGGARVQVVAPPATRDGFAVAVRRHVAAALPLTDYADSRLNGLPTAASARPDVDSLLSERRYPEVLSWAVKSRKNILISGGTSSGKTTLLNSLLSEIPPAERLIFIEDTPELRFSHENCVGLVAVRGGQGEALVTAEDLLQASLRMRPDRIILGELRGREAFTFLRAINTGHPGSMTTIHADSPERAFVQLAMMAMQMGLGITYSDAHELSREMVDVVVQLGRLGPRRCITEMLVRQ